MILVGRNLPQPILTVENSSEFDHIEIEISENGDILFLNKTYKNLTDNSQKVGRPFSVRNGRVNDGRITTNQLDSKIIIT